MARSCVAIYAQRLFWTISYGKICKYYCWCAQYDIFSNAQAVTSSFVFRFFLMYYGSYRYRYLGIFHVFLAKNLSRENLGVIYGTLYTYVSDNFGVQLVGNFTSLLIILTIFIYYFYNAKSNPHHRIIP